MSLKCIDENFDINNCEQGKPKFPNKLWRLVNDDDDDSCIWTASGEAILIHKDKFKERYLSRKGLFRTSNFKSFIRQLNLYGFRKVNKVRKFDHEIWWEYRHEHFIRDRHDLLAFIQRKPSTVIEKEKRCEVKEIAEVIQKDEDEEGRSLGFAFEVCFGGPIVTLFPDLQGFQDGQFCNDDAVM